MRADCAMPKGGKKSKLGGEVAGSAKQGKGAGIEMKELKGEELEKEIAKEASKDAKRGKDGKTADETEAKLSSPKKGKKDKKDKTGKDDKKGGKGKEGGKGGDGGGSSKSGDAKQSPKKGDKGQVANKILSKAVAGGNDGDKKMLASADAKFLESLGGVKSRDMGKSTDLQSTDLAQAQSMDKSNDSMREGGFMKGSMSKDMMGSSKDDEKRWRREEAAAKAQEAEDRLDERRVSKAAVLFAYGGEKRGYLIQIFDQVDVSKLSANKNAIIGKTFMDSQVVYAVVRKTGSTGEMYTFEHDTAVKDLRSYSIHSKKKIATTCTNVGAYDIRGLVFYVMEVRHASLRLDKTIPKKQAKKLVEAQTGEVLRFACQDADLLDDWIDAWIKCGAKEYRTPKGLDKDGTLTRSMLYSLRDPDNDLMLKDFDSPEQRAKEAEVWRKAQEARKGAHRRQTAGMKKKEVKAEQQKELMRQLSQDSDEMTVSQDQWRLEMLHEAEKSEKMEAMTKKERKEVERQEDEEAMRLAAEAAERMDNMGNGEKKALAKNAKALEKAASKGKDAEAADLAKQREKRKAMGSRGGPEAVKAAAVGRDGKEKKATGNLDATGKSQKMSLKELKAQKEGKVPKAGDREARIQKEQKEGEKKKNTTRR